MKKIIDINFLGVYSLFEELNEETRALLNKEDLERLEKLSDIELLQDKKIVALFEKGHHDLFSGSEATGILEYNEKTQKPKISFSEDEFTEDYQVVFE